MSSPHPLIATAIISAISAIAVAVISTTQLNKTVETKIAKLEPLPVGTVVASYLLETDFSKLSEGFWVLADGRLVTGSDYARLTKRENAPDLRGLFLRGHDPQGRRDPDGKTRTVGEPDPQKDSFQNHVHLARSLELSGNHFQHAKSDQGVAGHSNGGDPNKNFVSSTPLGVDGVSNVNTATETRPINAAVYYYLKINSKKS